METIKVKYLYDDLPELKIPDRPDIGIDIYSNEDIVIPYQEAKLVRTGVCLQTGQGWWVEVRDRSSVSKYCRVGAGIIDSATYTGEILINLYCHTRNVELIDIKGLPPWYDKRGYSIKRGHKIAQLIIRKNYNSLFSLEKVDELDETDRGSRGFGSSGI